MDKLTLKLNLNINIAALTLPVLADSLSTFARALTDTAAARWRRADMMCLDLAVNHLLVCN